MAAQVSPFVPGDRAAGSCRPLARAAVMAFGPAQDLFFREGRAVCGVYHLSMSRQQPGE